MLPELTAEDLREIAQTLLSYKPGIYWIGTQNEDGVNFVARIAPEYMNIINSKNLASWLKENYNFRSGGRPGELQGGGSKFDSHFIHDFYQWITKHTS